MIRVCQEQCLMGIIIDLKLHFTYIAETFSLDNHKHETGMAEAEDEDAFDKPVQVLPPQAAFEELVQALPSTTRNTTDAFNE